MTSPRIGVLCGLMGAALAWLIFRASYPVVTVPMDLQTQAGLEITAAQDEMIAATLIRTNRQNTLFALAVVGTLVGGSLGVAEGVARRSFKTVLMGGVVVAMIGGVAGVIGGLCSDLIYNSIKHFGEPLSLGGALLIQMIALAALGAGVGLGLGVSIGSVPAALHCLLAGLLAGLGAGLLYPIVLSLVLPGAPTQVLVPATRGNQLVWIALIALLIGVVVPGTATKRAT